jgi:hypothetical protein
VGPLGLAAVCLSSTPSGADNTREEAFAACFIKRFDYATLRMCLISPDHSPATVATQFSGVGIPDCLQKLVAIFRKCWQLLDAITVAMMPRRPEQIDAILRILAPMGKHSNR